MGCRPAADCSPATAGHPDRLGLSAVRFRNAAPPVSVVLEKTALELRGISCLELEEAVPPRQMICSSKMFGSRVRDIAPIRETVVAYVTKAAEKLRARQSLAGALQVAIRTGMHNPNQPRYANAISCPLLC